MRGLDTNVLVRFVICDDEAQATVAKSAIDAALARGTPLVVGLLVILEAEWVLRTRYRFGKETVVQIFKALLETRDLFVEGEESLEHALYLYENSSADFADCLMIARYQRIGCDAMLTFDAKAAKLPGCELLSG